MEALWFSVKQLYLVLLGLGLMLGLVTRRQVFRRIAMLIVTPVVVVVGWQSLQAVWQSTPFEARLLLLGIGLPLSLLVLLVGTSFGREVFASILGNAAYDGLRSRGCSFGCLPLLLLFILLFALLS